MAFLSLIPGRVWLVVGVLSALAVAWSLTVNQAYKNGYQAAVAKQEAANAQAFQEIIQEYNDATSNPLSSDAVDCILRELAGDGTGENCGSL